MTHAAITGWGKCLPPAVLTNQDLSTLLDTSDEWIVSRTGIRERRISHVGLEELAYVAAARALADHADIERIAVTALAAFGEPPHPLATIGLRNEAIERGRLRGGALRAVDAQVAGGLVDFVLHEIERGDLDVGIDDARRIRPRLKAVPGMRPPARVRARIRHAADCSVGLLFLRRRHG